MDEKKTVRIPMKMGSEAITINLDFGRYFAAERQNKKYGLKGTYVTPTPPTKSDAQFMLKWMLERVETDFIDKQFEEAAKRFPNSLRLKDNNKYWETIKNKAKKESSDKLTERILKMDETARFDGFIIGSNRKHTLILERECDAECPTTNELLVRFFVNMYERKWKHLGYTTKMDISIRAIETDYNRTEILGKVMDGGIMKKLLQFLPSDRKISVLYSGNIAAFGIDAKTTAYVRIIG